MSLFRADKTNYTPMAQVGPPTSGSWLKGAHITDADGSDWTCTVSGTPGVWIGLASTDHGSSHSVGGNDPVASGQSTGLLVGGRVTVSATLGCFDIQAGTGIVVNAVADPTHPTMTVVAWPNLLAVPDTYLTLAGETYVCIDATGTVIQLSDMPTETQRRDLIYLGWTSHLDQITMDGALTEPCFTADIGCQFQDLMENFGPFNVDGNVYTPNGVNLRLHRSAGRVFDNGTNYEVTAKNPNVISTNAESPVAELLYFYRDPAQPDGWKDNTPPVADIDPDHWDDGTGTLAAVPAGNWTIQLVTFYAPWEATDIQYGQEYYTTLAEAVAHYLDPIEVDPYNKYDVGRALLLVQQGATDLSDPTQCQIIMIGKFGGIATISGGAGIGEANTSSSAGLTGIGLTLPKSGVDLPFKNIASASSLVTVVNDAPNMAVTIDVNPDQVLAETRYTLNPQTNTTYIIAASDNQKLVTLENANPITVTVEANATVPVPTGTRIDLIQKGAGKVTFVGAVGVTINSKGGNKSIGAQHVAVTLIKVDTDIWYLIGDLVA